MLADETCFVQRAVEQIGGAKFASPVVQIGLVERSGLNLEHTEQIARQTRAVPFGQISFRWQRTVRLGGQVRPEPEIGQTPP